MPCGIQTLGQIYDPSPGPLLLSQWNWHPRAGSSGLGGSLSAGKQGAAVCSYPAPYRQSLRRYLKEFRTEQCPLFVQHKCTQHRPYTCFHWHFVNQRRRRSIRRRDGTFNYSPDVYCTKYDEATGLCPEGDE